MGLPQEDVCSISLEGLEFRNVSPRILILREDGMDGPKRNLCGSIGNSEHGNKGYYCSY